MATCDTSLESDASCLLCFNDQQLLAIIACQLATLNGMSCDTSLLEDASCLLCLNPQQLLAIIACQVSQISGGGGSSSPVQSGSGDPTGATSTSKPIYVDTTTANGPYVWLYVSSLSDWINI